MQLNLQSISGIIVRYETENKGAFPWTELKLKYKRHI